MRVFGQHVAPAMQLSSAAQHVLPQTSSSTPQHRLASAMQPDAEPSQQTSPQAFSGSQHVAPPTQTSPLSQQTLPHRFAGLQQASPARQTSPASQHMVPHANPGSQSFPRSPVSLPEHPLKSPQHIQATASAHIAPRETCMPCSYRAARNRQHAGGRQRGASRSGFINSARCGRAALCTNSPRISSIKRAVGWRFGGYGGGPSRVADDTAEAVGPVLRVALVVPGPLPAGHFAIREGVRRT
jgi:hypothetical protein